MWHVTYQCDWLISWPAGIQRLSVALQRISSSRQWHRDVAINGPQWPYRMTAMWRGGSWQQSGVSAHQAQAA